MVDDDCKLTRGQLENAFKKLDEQDRIRIEGMIVGAVEKMQKHPAKVMFGKLSGMELVARVGIWMAKNNIEKF